jgi:hypothetical protein
VQKLTVCTQPEYLRGRPVILDEAFDSPETAALRYEEGYEGGLLARADSPSDFLSMSAYGKPPPQSHGQSQYLGSCPVNLF